MVEFIEGWRSRIREKLIRTVSEYDAQKAKVSRFVDRIEERMPSRRFDTFSPSFYSDISNVLEEMYAPTQKILDGMPRGEIMSSPEEERDYRAWNRVRDNFFLGGGKGLGMDTYLMEIYHGSSFNTLLDKGLVEEREINQDIGV